MYNLNPLAITAFAWLNAMVFAALVQKIDVAIIQMWPLLDTQKSVFIFSVYTHNFNEMVK